MEKQRKCINSKDLSLYQSSFEFDLCIRLRLTLMLVVNQCLQLCLILAYTCFITTKSWLNSKEEFISRFQSLIQWTKLNTMRIFLKTVRSILEFREVINVLSLLKIFDVLFNLMKLCLHWENLLLVSIQENGDISLTS